MNGTNIRKVVTRRLWKARHAHRRILQWDRNGCYRDRHGKNGAFGFSDGFSGFTIQGSAAEYGTLKKAGLEKADMFIAVTGSDTLNIMCAEIALRHFKVPHVFARIYEPSLEEFSRDLGIFAVSPVSAVAEYFLEQIDRIGTKKQEAIK